MRKRICLPLSFAVCFGFMKSLKTKMEQISAPFSLVSKFGGEPKFLEQRKELEVVGWLALYQKK